MRERRKKERRNLKARPKSIKAKGKERFHTADRRTRPDRRLNSISVEFIPLSVFYDKSIAEDYSCN